MRRSIAALLCAIVVAFFQYQFLRGDVPQRNKLRLMLRKPDLIDARFIAVNDWRYTVSNNGIYMQDLNDIDADQRRDGGQFPRWLGKTVIFAGGFYFGTLKDGEPVVSEAEFNSEFQPGRILASNKPLHQLQAESPGLSTNKVYTLYKGQSINGDWPADAPRDRFGQPAIIADVQTWAVFNDLDTTLNQESPAQSPHPGLGIEVRQESFVVKGPVIGNTVFFKFTVRNMTDRDYPDSYFGLWSDPDVDDQHTDIMATDTVRNMLYVFNDNNSETFLAVGVDLLQGPVAKITESPGRVKLRFQSQKNRMTFDSGTGRYIQTTVGDDQFVLGTTSTASYQNGTDPINNKERYNLMAGLVKETGVQKFGCGINDYYAFRDDPLTGISECNVSAPPDPNAFPSDIRGLISAGPFTIPAGGSQEIWAAFVGGYSAVGNRLSAVVNLRVNDDYAQTVFNAGLIAVRPPESPSFSVTSLAGRVVLQWTNNAESSEDLYGVLTGINTSNGYSETYRKNDFQGYRIYKSLTGLPGTFARLAQYDKDDDIRVVQYSEISENGNLLFKEADLGSDTGLRYVFEDDDVINNQKYFYCVTAYDAQPYITAPDSIVSNGMIFRRPAGVPVSLESAIDGNAMGVVPAKPMLGHAYDAKINGVTRLSSSKAGRVETEVVDPDKVTGHDYRLEFFFLTVADGYSGYDLAFRLRDRSTNALVPFTNRLDDPFTPVDERFFSTEISNSLDKDAAFPIADGLLIKVYSDAGYLGWDYSPGVPGQRWFDGLRYSSFPCDDGPRDPFNPPLDGPQACFFAAGAAVNKYLSMDITFSGNPSGWSVAYAHSTAAGPNTKTIPVPFQAFEVDTVDGNPAPRQVNVVVRDASNLNGWFLDNTLGGDGTGPAQRCYIYLTDMDYDAGAGSLLGVSVPDIPAVYAMDLVPYGIYGKTWNMLLTLAAVDSLTPDERDSIYKQVPDNGTLHIKSGHAFTAADSFLISSSASTAQTGRTLKRGLEAITVVPNPFYITAFEAGHINRAVKFTNLPDQCSIKIFTVSGDLVRVIYHNASSNNNRIGPVGADASPPPAFTSVEEWNLTNHRDRAVAGGMYIALIEAPGIGKTTVKFAVIR